MERHADRAVVAREVAALLTPGGVASEAAGRQ
jgi:hypothetical protein